MTEPTANIDDILAEAENPAYIRTTTARILLRQDLLARHEQLDLELAAAIQADTQSNDDPTAPTISVQLTELEAEIEAAKVGFRFRSIGHRAWADLMAQHPPTKEQLKAFGRLDHNPLTFPLAAISASCMEPVMTVEQVTRLEQVLNDTQFNLLFVRSVEANTGGLDTPKSVAAAGLTRLQNLRSEKPPTTIEPLEASSLAES